MKNTFKFKAILRIAGIIALAVVIGFSMTACDDSGDNNGGNSGGNGGQTGGSTSSVITITNIPAEHVGKYLWVEITLDYDASKLMYGLSNDTKFTSYTARSGKAITGTTETLNSFHYVSGGYDKYTGNATIDKYTNDDNETRSSVMVLVSPSGTDMAASGVIKRYNAGSVTLTNGSTSLDFSTLATSGDR